jgi:DnaJ-class molecular chaperone
MGIPVGGSKKDRQTKLKNRMKGDLAYHVLSDKEKRKGYDVYEEKYGKKAMDKWRDEIKKSGSVTKADEAQADYAAHVQKHEGIEMNTYKKGGRVTKRKKTRSSGAATHGFGKEIR